jgi:predicted nucleic acid-binding Zn ribbon protein
MNKTEKKQCLECGQELFGRIDKKFCSDYCRNSYNNKLNRSTKNLIRNTNNLLRKNYRILEKLNPDQKTRTTKDNLLRKGFNFDYFTSIYTTKTGNVYYFVYDQGYLELENNYYALVKRISND